MSKSVLFAALVLLSCLLFLLELDLGQAQVGIADMWHSWWQSEPLSAMHYLVIHEVRLPRALTAVLAGSALAVSGLLMQSYFRNPLAGPSVLGISSGAGLGVGLLVLAFGGTSTLFRVFGTGGHMAVALAALAGAAAVLLLILAVERKLGDPVTLLILGLMLGYLTGSALSVLEYFAEEGALKRFVMWGLGSFGNVGWPALGVLSVAWVMGMGLLFGIRKNLDPLLLGDAYAESMGVNVKQVRGLMIVSAGILAGVVTAFCGPVAFLGLAVPHVARVLFSTGHHKTLIPAVILIGTSLALGCDLIARLPWSDKTLPLNAITSLAGAPVVLALVLRGRRLGRLM